MSTHIILSEKEEPKQGDSKTPDEIQKIIFNRTNDDELELRIGYISDGNFVPNVRIDYFEKLQTILSASTSLLGPTIYTKNETSIVSFFQGDYRRIETTGIFHTKSKDLLNAFKKSNDIKIELKDNENQIDYKNVVYQEKLTLASHDIDFYFYKVRLSLAKETKLSNVEEIILESKNIQIKKDITSIKIGGKKFNKKELERNRIRSIFGYINFEIHLTIIKGKTLEVEIELSRNITTSKDVLNILSKVLYFLFDSPIIMEANFIESTLNYTNTMLKSIITNKPVDLTIKKLPLLQDHYNTTNKLDGVRKLLIIPKIKENSSQYYILRNEPGINKKNPSSLIQFFSQHAFKYSSTILDGEYLEETHTYYIFDVIAFNGKYLTFADKNKKYPDFVGRLSHLLGDFIVEINKIQPYIRVVVKDFYYQHHNGYINTVDILLLMRDANISMGKKTKYIDLKQTAKNIIETNDGIIYTPVNVGYFDEKIKTLKYKFPQRLSIDVEVRPTPNQINTYDMYIHEGEKKIILKIPPLITSIPLPPHTIVEVEYDGNRAHLIKIRHDKSNPNKKIQVDETISLINNPITVTRLLKSLAVYLTDEQKKLINKQRIDDVNALAAELDKVKLSIAPSYKGIYRKEYTEMLHEIKGKKAQIQSDAFKDLRKENNLLKWKLIGEFAKDKRVVDIGYGQGGDMNKYANNLPKILYAVEPDNDNFKEAESRLNPKDSEDVKNFKKHKYPSKHKYSEISEDLKKPPKDYKKIQLLKPRVKLINKDFLELDINTDLNVNEKQFDVIFSMMSLTFFFKSSDKLKKLTDLIKRILAPGGVFVGYTVDGEAMQQYLRDTLPEQEKELGGGSYIRKQYVKKDTIEFGKKIQIQLAGTIVKDQTEYLAFFPLLKEYMKPFDLEMTKLQHVDKTVNISEIEKELAELNRYFVFRNGKAQQFEVLKEIKFPSLKANQMEELSSKMSVDYKEQLVRIGVITNNTLLSCIICGYLPEFINYEENYQKDQIAKLQHKINQEIQTYDWIYYDQNYLKTLGNNMKKILEEQKINTDKILNYISNRITKAKTKAEPLTKYFNIFVSAYNIIVKKSLSLKEFHNIFDTAIKRSVKEFITTNLNQLNRATILFYSDYFKINIYLIDHNLQPYQDEKSCYNLYDENRSSIVLFYNGQTYDTIGVKRVQLRL